MERTQTHVVDPAFTQGDELGYHINNVGGIKYSFYGELVYHERVRTGFGSPKIQKRVQKFFEWGVLKIYWLLYFLFLTEKHLFCNENFIDK